MRTATRDIDVADESAGPCLTSQKETLHADDFNANPPEALDTYLRKLHHRPLLTAGEEVTLAGRIARGDREAHRLLVESNLRLVVAIARRYLRKVHHMALLDLIAEGNIGLMHAADKFDATRGFRFSTYAVWWIRQTIERAIMNQERMIRAPVHVRKLTDRLLAATYRLTNETGREPTCIELAQQTGIPVAEIPRLQAVMYDTVVSGDDSCDDEGRHTFLDNMIDMDMPDHCDIVARREDRERLCKVLSRLTPREQKVLKLRFGLFDGDIHTLDSVADVIGVTRERVRQIQNQAIRRLRAFVS